jgi:HK97 family phage major capsid protein
VSIQNHRETIAKSTGHLLRADPEFFRSVEARFGALKSKGTPHAADLRRLQGEVGGWLNKLVEKPDWNSAADQPVYDGAMAWANLLGAEIDLVMLAGASSRSAPARDGWVNAHTGEPIRMLAPKERLADRDPRNDDTSVGAVLAALLTGPKSPTIKAALSEGTDSAGGFSIPLTVLPEFIDRLRSKTQFIQAGARTVILDGMKTRIMRIATDPTPGWRAENAAVTESDPTFDAIDLVPKSLAVLVKVPIELLADSVNVNTALEQALVGALSVELDRACLFGTGASNQPLGLFNASAINTVSMGTNGAIPTSYDQMLDALYELELDNCDTSTAGIWHPRTARTFRKFKDSTNQPLQLPPALVDLPMLSTTSIPITQTQGTSTDCSTLLVGDFTRGILGLRQELRIQVLNETYMGNLQGGFIAHLRADVAFERSDAFCRIVGLRP